VTEYAGAGSVTKGSDVKAIKGKGYVDGKNNTSKNPN